MKTSLLLFLLAPAIAWAQADTLKPIGTDLIPVYGGQYGSHVGVRYTYDGLDVRRPKELGQYIMASGNPEAMAAFQRYIGGRKAGGWMIAAGLVSAAIGLPIMLSNKPNSNGQFTITQPFQCPPGYFCGSVGGNTPTIQVPDASRKRSFNTGAAMWLAGSSVALIGVLLNRPGQNLRSAVQYYNRALKQRGISWRVSPYSTFSASGMGLVGTF